MPLYTYACAANHISEKLVAIANRDDLCKCNICGQILSRQRTTVGFKLEPFTGDFPDAAAKWERQHAEKLAWELKHERQHDEMK